MRMIRVDLAEGSYDVFVGEGALGHVRRVLPNGASRAAVVTQPGIPHSVDPGIEHRVFDIGNGEQAKSMATVEELCRSFARWGLTRRDVVIAVGGGMVTDVAGFAAAVYHRGVAVVHVATTLLGQVDAAIGGKTGVNLPEGKNLVGAFWQPHAVICDTATLATLSRRDLRSGMGEVAKYHFLGAPELDRLTLTDRVARCVELKARVVRADEREDGLRATLNYGHTLAHALEVVTDHAMSHGEAVAVGLVFAAELAHEMGRIASDRVAEHRRVVRAYDLPSSIPDGINVDEIIELMARDKKRAGRGFTFVLDNGAAVELVEGVDPSLVRRVVARIRA